MGLALPSESGFSGLQIAAAPLLPPRSRLHDVFHVSQLKVYHGEPLAAPPPLPAIHHGRVIPSPLQVLKVRLARGICQPLVRWEGQLLLKLPRKTWQNSSADIPLSSSRTSCLSKGGVMSCGAGITAAATGSRVQPNHLQEINPQISVFLFFKSC